MRKPTKALAAVLLIGAASVNADVVRTRGGGSGGGGVATAVTPGVTTVTGCQDLVLYGDNSSLLNCEAGFGYAAATNILTAPNATISTLLTIPAGTTAATGTLLGNDTDTWIGSIGAGNISFYTNNAERFRFSSAGDIVMPTAATALAMGAASPDVAYARLGAGVARIRAGLNGTDRFYMGGGGAVASATALPVPTGNLFHVTGTTTITSITTTGLGTGLCFTMIFDGVLTVTDGSNLVLAGNFVTTAGDTLSVCFDGTSFYETARSNND